MPVRGSSGRTWKRMTWAGKYWPNPKHLVVVRRSWPLLILGHLVSLVQRWLCWLVTVTYLTVSRKHDRSFDLSFVRLFVRTNERTIIRTNVRTNVISECTMTTPSLLFLIKFRPTSHLHLLKKFLTTIQNVVQMKFVVEECQYWNW